MCVWSAVVYIRKIDKKTIAMLSFYPGPSKVYPQLRDFMDQAMDSGILSVNHRSPEFVALMRQTVALMRQKLEVPAHYTVLLASSATECWELLSESFLDQHSLHVYNGAFGQKWYEGRLRLSPHASGLSYPPHRAISLHAMERAGAKQAAVICLTLCETSNATRIHPNTLGRIRRKFPQALLFADATSYMAGGRVDWLSLDACFASVQKCFGLPAGMALLVCSPRCVQQARLLSHDLHYNSLVNAAKQMENFQTTHTPNVLGVYLLNRVLDMRPTIGQTNRQLRLRAQRCWKRLLQAGFTPLVPYERLRSETVLALRDTPERVKRLKADAKAAGFLIGNGYGDWKDNTFRIANFPAITDAEMDALLDFLCRWRQQEVSS